MTNFYSKYDIVIVKFPFSDIKAYKARPAVVVSNSFFNQNSRNTIFILAISSKIDTKLEFEPKILDWQKCGLLKQSIFKSAIATIETNMIIHKIGYLTKTDREHLDNLIERIIVEEKRR